MLTAERLKQVLTYDPETGIFMRGGEIAGYVDADGYRYVRVDGVQYLAHRLAWFYMTGEWPVAYINHRNDDRADNCWLNLRLASAAQTARTRKTTNQLGVKGVRMTPRGTYRACIHVNRRNVNLGTFTTLEAAAQAYADAANKYFGEFARAMTPEASINFGRDRLDRCVPVAPDFP